MPHAAPAADPTRFVRENAGVARAELGEHVAALVAVYIVLGVLYESLAHPLTIISTLPSSFLPASTATAPVVAATEPNVVSTAVARAAIFVASGDHAAPASRSRLAPSESGPRPAT